MGDFVTGLRPLPPPKVDAFPPQGVPGELDASDINDIWNALLDLRTGLGFPNRTVVTDSDYAVTPTDSMISFQALTAARTVTLPSASSGLRQIIIKDESGAASESIPISVVAQPGETVDGTTSPTTLAVVIRHFGAAALYSNGVQWRTLYSDRAYVVATGAIGQSIDSMVLSVFSLNVRWFGAKGDGVTDDTVAIQNALNAATAAIDIQNFENLSPAGGPIEVFFPSGLYKVTDTITVRGVVSLRGDGNALTYGGARIRQYTAGKHLFQIAGISSHDNASIQFRDLGLSSNSSTHAAGTALIYIPDTVVNPASIYIRAVWFQSPEYWAIRADKCDDLVIEDCTFDITTERSISLGSATGLITNCNITNNYFFFVNSGIVRVINAGRVIFDGNRVAGQSTSPTTYVVDALNFSPVSGDSLIVSNNVVMYANGLLNTKFNTSNVFGNIVRLASGPIITFGGGGTIGNISVTGNNFGGAFPGSAIDGSGVSVQFSSIVGNSFGGTDGGGPGGTAIALTGGSTGNNKVQGNSFFGFTTNTNVVGTANTVESVFVGSGSAVGLTGTGGASGAVGVMGNGTGSAAGVAGNGGPTAGAHGVDGFGGSSGGRGVVGTGTSGWEGVVGVGQGTATGVLGVGGATGPGVTGTGGATSGVGVVGTGTAGNSAGGSFTGQGSAAGVTATGGATGIGGTFTGGASGAAGVSGTGTSGNIGVVGQGNGAAAGVSGTGGATAGAHGVDGTGGSGGGRGVVGTGTNGWEGVVGNGNGTAAGVAAVGTSTGPAVQTYGSLVYTRIVTNWAASVTINAALGNVFEVPATTAIAHAIAAPTNPLAGQEIAIRIKVTVAALPATTWNAAFKMAAWTDPANGFSGTVKFIYDGTNWVESERSVMTVPN